VGVGDEPLAGALGFGAETLDCEPESLRVIGDGQMDRLVGDRYGMTCYRVTLAGGYKMWIWWDGAQLWEDEPDAPKPGLIQAA
jgi:hypothetical protein